MGAEYGNQCDKINKNRQVLRRFTENITKRKNPNALINPSISHSRSHRLHWFVSTTPVLRTSYNSNNRSIMRHIPGMKNST